MSFIFPSVRFVLLFQQVSFAVHHSAISPACSHHSLPICSFFNPLYGDFSTLHTQTWKVLTRIFISFLVWHLSCYPHHHHQQHHHQLPLHTVLALQHDDTDSAAEIKGQALITDSTKCRPAAPGIRAHYKHRDSQLRAVMTNHRQQPVDNRETTLPSLVKP